MKSHLSVLGLGLTLGALLGGTAAADTVTLNNGREIHGRLISEGAKVLEIRTGKGVITIPKFKVATFTENENMGDYSKPRSVAELREIERQRKEADAASEARRKGTDAPKKTGGKKTDAPKGGDDAGKGGDEWAWGEDVSEEKQEELEPIRDRYLERLKALGRTEDERLAEIVLSKEEEPDLKEKIRLLGWKRRRGRRGGTAGSNVYREKAKKEILASYGERAIPQLIKALSSENLYQVRMAAQTLGEVLKSAKDKENAGWLVHHFEAPVALMRLVEHEGDPTSPFVRSDGNAALEAVTGANQKWPQGANQPFRNNKETSAYKKWKKAVPKLVAKWKKEEAAKAAERTELKEKLDQVRAGKNPEASDEEEE